MSFDTRAKYAVQAAKRGDFEVATSTVIDLVSEDWNNAVAHRAWGCVLLAQGQPADAVGAFRTAISLDSSDPELYFDFAKALLAESNTNPYFPLQNWLEAKEAVEAGLKLAPHHDLGIRLFTHIEQHRDRILN